MFLFGKSDRQRSLMGSSPWGCKELDRLSNWTHTYFRSLYWICYNIVSALCFSWPRDMRNLSSLTRDWTCTHYTGSWSLNHWITREVPKQIFFKLMKECEQNNFSLPDGTVAKNLHLNLVSSYQFTLEKIPVCLHFLICKMEITIIS